MGYIPAAISSLYDRPWICPWIKSIYDKLDDAFRVCASQLLCRIMHLWRHQQSMLCHQQNVNWWVRYRVSMWRSLFVINYGFLMLCKKQNNVSTVRMNCLYACLVLFWCLFRNEGNKHQNEPSMNPWTVFQWSTYIILYECDVLQQ